MITLEDGETIHNAFPDRDFRHDLMKLNYYSETDSLYIELASRPAADSREVMPGVVLDVDADGRLVGIDVDRASNVADLSRLAAETLPATSFSLPK